MAITPEKALESFVARYPTQTAAAKALRISKAYLSDLLSGRRNYSAAVLEKLGLEPVTTFRKKRAS